MSNDDLPVAWVMYMCHGSAQARLLLDSHIRCRTATPVMLCVCWYHSTIRRQLDCLAWSTADQGITDTNLEATILDNGDLVMRLKGINAVDKRR